MGEVVNPEQHSQCRRAQVLGQQRDLGQLRGQTGVYSEITGWARLSGSSEAWSVSGFLRSAHTAFPKTRQQP